MMTWLCFMAHKAAEAIAAWCRAYYGHLALTPPWLMMAALLMARTSLACGTAVVTRGLA